MGNVTEEAQSGIAVGSVGVPTVTVFVSFIFFVCRASESFAYRYEGIHKEFGLTRGDVTF